MKSLRYILVGTVALFLTALSLNALNCGGSLPTGLLEGEVYYDDSVQDVGGQPVPYAAVYVKNSSISTVADEDGKWTLPSVPEGD